ncbi:MAG TPA: divergent polysaccharide deacetylase family protein [Rhizomicrobium sp.]|nr:divergent polysaccharide deacetylase family protein [Rhizomicrobium sp.]
MLRAFLIRRLPDIAFAALFGAGAWFGGGAALAGLPQFLDRLMPGMAAQAGDAGRAAPAVAHLSMPQGFAESRHAPQVLYPLVSVPPPAWLDEAVMRPAPQPQGAAGQAQPVIAICIDDLGEDIAGTDQALGLPKDVALSFLPYAEATSFLAEAATRAGHLVLAHVPMEAKGHADPGPMALRTGMKADEIARRVTWNLSRVPGIAGINNHEGSRFTADAEAFAPVAAALKARHLFFLDSRTGPDSRAASVASAYGVLTAGRDIFLDDDQRAAAVAAQLDALVREAKRTGAAIAIGHPHDTTLRLLAAWLAQDHGVALVPLDEAMRRKAERALNVAAR